MGVTETEVSKANEHYKVEEGADIRYLSCGQQRILVNAFIHGAEGAIKLLIEEAKVKEREFIEEDNS